MPELNDKTVLVLGWKSHGRAAAALLRNRGARVIVCPGPGSSDEPADLSEAAGPDVEIRADPAGIGKVDLVVMTPPLSPESPLVRPWVECGVEVISEMELGYEEARCLTIAIAGTNGKTTTASMVGQLLQQTNRRTLLAGGDDTPLCRVVDQTRDLDFVTLEAGLSQLEGVRHFRPAVAVLLNTAPCQLDRYPTPARAVRTWGRLFANQQIFDWAIVQSEALALLRAHRIELPSKIITFSAENRRADISLDRGLLVSQLPDWTGPLLDMEKCLVKGIGYAEDLMAALAVGHVLRLPLDQMAQTLMAHPPSPHCFDPVAAINQVLFVDDANSTNPDSLRKALSGPAFSRRAEPNVVLIAGGLEEAYDYHDLGPLLSCRAKHAFLLGPAAERLRAAWGLFTPCTLLGSLLEAVQRSAEIAVPGDLVLFSPACSNHDKFESCQPRGEEFRQAVRVLTERSSNPRPARTGEPISDRPEHANVDLKSDAALVREAPPAAKPER